MTAQVYGIISISSLILSGLMLFVSIFLFFQLRIKSVIGELSGKTAAKQVEEIRRQNRAVKKRASVLMGDGKQEMSAELQQIRKVYAQSPNETTIPGTTGLSSDMATTVLNETVVLQNERDEAATTLLQEVQEDEEYVILDEVMEIHTQEVIKG